MAVPLFTFSFPLSPIPICFIRREREGGREEEGEEEGEGKRGGEKEGITFCEERELRVPIVIIREVVPQLRPKGDPQPLKRDEKRTKEKEERKRRKRRKEEESIPSIRFVTWLHHER